MATIESADRAMLDEGKTKTVARIAHPFEPARVRLNNKDDATAGDGARHEIILDKAELSNRTNANTCELLSSCGFSVAFIEKDSPTSFIAYELAMIKLEVVTRGLAWGSYLERHPSASQGDRFETPVVEFYLKTKDRQWPTPKGICALPCDDPLMEITATDVFLYHPHQPYVKGTYFCRLSPAEAFPIQGTRELLPVLAATNRAVYETLAYAWSRVGKLEDARIDLPDMKIEYGFDTQRRLWIGDVIDAESCRLLVNGEHASKQGFREGAPVEIAKLQLARAADLSDRFAEVADDVEEWAAERFTFRSSGMFPTLR